LPNRTQAQHYPLLKIMSDKSNINTEKCKQNLGRVRQLANC
jgi:hypothetical protein